MRFLHTSDWHLGRIFHGLHMTEEQATVLEQLITLAVTHKVDAVLIAGDIYDRAVPPTAAVDLLDKTISTLVQKHHIPVLMIAGNHDNPRRLGFGQTLFAANQLYIYGPVVSNAKPLVLTDQYGPVYFVPLTYCEPLEAAELSGEKITTHEEALKWQIKNMLEQIPPHSRMVALAHVFLTGAAPSEDSERPLAIGGSSTVSVENFAPFCYTALGHLHACQEGTNKVRYSGSLLKYSFNETKQAKGVHIVDLDGEGKITVATFPLMPAHELACLRGTFEDLINNPRQEFFDHYLQITLTDQQPILDAKYRLEQVYPHILHLEYARLAGTGSGDFSPQRHPKLGLQELFQGFFSQVNERDLSPEEAALLAKIINTTETATRQE